MATEIPGITYLLLMEERRRIEYENNTRKTYEEELRIKKNELSDMCEMFECYKPFYEPTECESDDEKEYESDTEYENGEILEKKYDNILKLKEYIENRTCIKCDYFFLGENDYNLENNPNDSKICCDCCLEHVCTGCHFYSPEFETHQPFIDSGYCDGCLECGVCDEQFKNKNRGKKVFFKKPQKI